MKGAKFIGISGAMLSFVGSAQLLRGRIKAKLLRLAKLLLGVGNTAALSADVCRIERVEVGTLRVRLSRFLQLA